MIEKIEHIGIAVKNLDEANKIYEELLGTPPYKMEKVDSEGVSTSFFKTGDSKVELLQAIKQESAIAKFIAKKGEGIHHIAFAVKNIHKEIKRLKESGYIIINESPKMGADNKLVCFVHPKNTKGVLIEICQEIP